MGEEATASRSGSPDHNLDQELDWIPANTRNEGNNSTNASKQRKESGFITNGSASRRPLHQRHFHLKVWAHICKIKLWLFFDMNKGAQTWKWTESGSPAVWNNLQAVLELELLSPPSCTHTSLSLRASVHHRWRSCSHWDGASPLLLLRWCLHHYFVNNKGRRRTKGTSV